MPVGRLSCKGFGITGQCPKCLLSHVYRMAAIAGNIQQIAVNYTEQQKATCHETGISTAKCEAIIDARAVARMAADYTILHLEL